MIKHKTLSPRMLALGAILALLVVSMLAWAPFGHADPSSTPTVPANLVDPNKDGSITVHSLVGDTGVTANGAEATPAPTNAIIQGSVFKLTKHAGIDVSTNTGMTSAKDVTLTSFSADSSFGTSGAMTGTTSTDGTYKFEGLKPGVYKLEQISAPAGKQTAAPAIVVLPLTNPQGNGFMYDIHVYPKNAALANITKENTTPAGTLLHEGSQMTFKITVPIPSHTGKTFTEFTVTDKPVSGLSVDENSIASVKLGSMVLEKGDDKDYKVAKEGANVKVSFVGNGLTKLGSTNETQLIVEVTATVTNIANTTDKSVKNSASYTYKFSDGTGGNGETGDTNSPIVVFGYVNIKNTNGTTDLTGGKFKVGKCKADNKSVDPTSVAFSDVSVGKVGPIGPISGAKLCVEQTTPPTDYALNPEATSIEFTAEKINAATDKSLEALVKNVSANDFLNKLPLTGGPGVIAFLVGGAMLLIAAVVTMVRKRHKD